MADVTKEECAISDFGVFMQVEADVYKIVCTLKNVEEQWNFIGVRKVETAYLSSKQRVK